MKQYGDITKIDGAKIEMVDCICGGSPAIGQTAKGRNAVLPTACGIVR